MRLYISVRESRQEVENQQRNVSINVPEMTVNKVSNKSRPTVQKSWRDSS